MVSKRADVYAMSRADEKVFASRIRCAAKKAILRFFRLDFEIVADVGGCRVQPQVQAARVDLNCIPMTENARYAAAEESIVYVEMTKIGREWMECISVAVFVMSPGARRRKIRKSFHD